MLGDCPMHKPYNHKDGYEAWCFLCGRTKDHRTPESKGRTPFDVEYPEYVLRDMSHDELMHIRWMAHNELKHVRSRINTAYSQKRALDRFLKTIKELTENGGEIDD